MNQYIAKVRFLNNLYCATIDVKSTICFSVPIETGLMIWPDIQYLNIDIISKSQEPVGLCGCKSSEQSNIGPALMWRIS